MNENKISKKYPSNHLLRAARERHGWTHEDVAERIGLPDPHTVGRWERGVSMPRFRYRRELCRIFTMSPDELGLLPDGQTRSEQQIASSAQNAQESEPLWKVPVMFTSFIGREREVTEVCTLLGHANIRLVTLFGPGGIGKTRLSIRIAEETRANFASGVCFISLAAVREPDLVIPTIANSLGIQESSAFPLADLVKMKLRGKRILLLLDNFEQVASGAQVVEELLAACPGVKAIVTSRAVLRLQAEHIFQVSPLKLPDLKRLSNAKQAFKPELLSELSSVALFVQQARTVQHDFQITTTNAQAIAECCIHLDGLPLAIELAAARIRLFSPQSLLARLSQRLYILKSDISLLPERQRTLYNTIKWSYDLLNEQERWLFRQLSVFQGGWTLETVEQMLGNKILDSFDIVDVLSSLLDKSLVQRVDSDDGEACFSMLETVREFGLACLRDDGELEACQRTHACYYLAYIERAAPYLKNAQQRVWLARLERGQENLRAALEWFIAQEKTDAALHFCDAFGKFCGLSGYWSEERRWFALALALPGESSMVRARVLRRAGHLAYRLRDLEKARVWLEESVRISRALDDKVNLAGALSGLAWAVVRQHDTAISALHLLEEGVEVARASADQWCLANTLERQGSFMYRQGLLDTAYQLLAEGVALMRAVGDRECLARLLERFASIELARGNMAQALALAQESFVLAQELDTVPLKALVLDSLGAVALFQGDYEQAARLFRQRLAFARELGDIPAIAKCQVRLGDIALAQGAFEHAEALVREGLQFFRAHGDSPDIALALDTYGTIKLAQGCCGEAGELYREALWLNKDDGDKKSVGKHLIGLAQVALAQGHTEEAISFFGSATSWIDATIDMHPAQREHYYRAIKQLYTQLGDVRFEDAWSRGTVMTLDHVLLEKECP